MKRRSNCKHELCMLSSAQPPGSFKTAYVRSEIARRRQIRGMALFVSEQIIRAAIRTCDRP